MSGGAARLGRVAPGAAVVVALASLGATGADVADRTVRDLTLGPGQSLALRITNGRVVITGSARADVRLEVQRRAPSPDRLSAMPVAIAETTDAVSIDVRQRGDGADAALTSDVTLDVPTAVDLSDVQIAEGRLELRRLSGRVRAQIRRGPISASRVTGTVRLETVIGDLDVSEARAVPGGLLRLRTFNGDLRLRFAEAPTHARVMALALNGAIQSTLPLTVKDGWGPRFAEGTFGRGEPVVSLDVVTGTITIEAPRTGKP